jgi:hypothetical protein
VRAYNAGQQFYSEFIGFLDRNGSWWFAFIATARWIGFRLDMISAVMLTAGSMLAMAIHDKVCSAAQWDVLRKVLVLHCSVTVLCHCLVCFLHFCHTLICSQLMRCNPGVSQAGRTGARARHEPVIHNAVGGQADSRSRE